MSFVSFGEIMLRLTPQAAAEKLESAQSLSMGYAGAESNVLSALSKLGNKTSFITKLPNNPLGDGAIASINSYGIDTSKIVRGGERIGTYFIEMGVSIRPSRVVYDRANSAISQIRENEFDWGKILNKTQKWLHLSGITPALSEQCAKETIKAAKAAKLLGVKISFDMNFRRTLWHDVDNARDIFSELLHLADLAFGNVGVMNDVFSAQYSQDDTATAALTLLDDFNLQYVGFTRREHLSASKNVLSAILTNGKQTVESNSYEIDIIDRLGSGDAYAAGILHGIECSKTKKWNKQKIVEFAAAAFALKHTIAGDQHLSSEEDILSVVQGNVTGHVIR